MWKLIRLVCLAVATISGTLVFSAGVASAHSGYGPKAYVCTGGDFATGNLTPIPSGTYSSIRVEGACAVAPGAVIDVKGSVHVGAGAALDAQSAPSTIKVRGNVTAGRGSILGLGCQPPALVGNSGHECIIEPEGHSTITVRGSVVAFGADTVLLNGITVKGNVVLVEGGGAIPWSVKNNTIGGNLIVGGVTAEWVGVMFNNIGGNAILIAITVTAPHEGDAVYVVRNTVGRNLICGGLEPGISGGFVPGSVNVVGGHTIGQCRSVV